MGSYRDALSEDELKCAGAPMLAKLIRMTEFIESVRRVLASDDQPSSQRPAISTGLIWRKAIRLVSS
jgi:hypothetical protein